MPPLTPGGSWSFEWDGDNQFLAFTLHDPEGRHYYIAFNAHHQKLSVTVPDGSWRLIVNTAAAPPTDFYEEAEASLMK